MFFPFMNYVVQQYAPRNGAVASYVLPYRALVFCGDFRPDDTKGGTVHIEHNRRVQPSGTVKQYILNANTGAGSLNGDEPLCGAVVAEAGDTLRVTPVDDFDVKVFILRLPE